MRLYAYYRSSASYRVRIALALKGVSYEYIAVDISRGGHVPDSYSDVNAMRQVPVLEWRDGRDRLIRLTQSVAIVEYLDACFPDPPLFARDSLARARQREAVEIVNAGIQPMQNNKTLAALREAGGRELEERFRDETIARGLVALERCAQAHEGPFFMGDRPCVVDLFIIPQLYNARRFALDLSALPRLVEIEQQALSHEAFRAAHPDRQPDAPGRERSAP